jgi:hypothetical protein
LSLDGKGFLGYAGNGGDPYIRHKQEAAIEPVRVVVEFEHGEFARLDALSRGDGASEFLRLLALQAIEAHAVLMPRLRQRDGSLRPKAY